MSIIAFGTSDDSQAIVDATDMDLLDWRWRSRRDPHTYYIYRNIRENKSVYMHRVIMERMLDRPLNKGEEVDHIDGNGWNNSRANLRLATRTQNMHNRRRNLNSKTGHKGVSTFRNGKYRAQIRVGGNKVYLGTFATPEAAYEAYCKAAQEFFGEYARLD